MSICLIVSLAFRWSELSLPIVVVVKDSIHNCRLHRSGNQGSFNGRAPSPLNVGLFTHDNVLYHAYAGEVGCRRLRPPDNKD